MCISITSYRDFSKNTRPSMSNKVYPTCICTFATITLTHHTITPSVHLLKTIRAWLITWIRVNDPSAGSPTERWVRTAGGKGSPGRNEKCWSDHSWDATRTTLVVPLIHHSRGSFRTTTIAFSRSHSLPLFAQREGERERKKDRVVWIDYCLSVVPCKCVTTRERITPTAVLVCER